VIGLPFYRRLVLPFALFLFVVLQADAIINWVALRDQLAAASPWHVATLFTTLFTLWGVIAGGSLRPVWRQPAIAFLVRQPLSRWQWVRYLLPPLSIAFVPVFGIWWLAPHYSDAPIHYVAFVGLAWTTILGASFRGVAAAKWVATGIVATAVLILGYAYQPAVAFLAAIASVALLPLSVSEIRNQIARTDQVGDGNLASISPIITIIRRDALCLWRVERKSLFRMIQLAIVVALLMLALRINGDVVGRETFELSCGLLSLALLPTYDILTRLKSQLGLELMRRRWPLSYRQRAVAEPRCIVLDRIFDGSDVYCSLHAVCGGIASCIVCFVFSSTPEHRCNARMEPVGPAHSYDTCRCFAAVDLRGASDVSRLDGEPIHRQGVAKIYAAVRDSYP